GIGTEGASAVAKNAQPLVVGAIEAVDAAAGHCIPGVQVAVEAAAVGSAEGGGVGDAGKLHRCSGSVFVERGGPVVASAAVARGLGSGVQTYDRADGDVLFEHEPAERAVVEVARRFFAVADARDVDNIDAVARGAGAARGA